MAHTTAPLYKNLGFGMLCLSYLPAASLLELQQFDLDGLLSLQPPRSRNLHHVKLSNKPVKFQVPLPSYGRRPVCLFFFYTYRNETPKDYLVPQELAGINPTYLRELGSEEKIEVLVFTHLAEKAVIDS